ncbi:flavin prenyltransferase UbiX [Vreelandella rituensis]|uniref:Flavin prenyltransferase UbiX n=1 Tax=Vreelandella rituensis TaxID=2282306 RepID=A0A368TVJ3_9GAMM|nr:flavin prenyltransferase UbiX [Halomonas rituensis]RCV88785.1 UbiX family flavin prenyltransferase [Halomonas rituensis]
MAIDSVSISGSSPSAVATAGVSAGFRSPITVALTGASGAQYGLRLIDVLVASGHEVWVMISKAAHMVIATEMEISLPAQPERLAQALCERSGAAAGQIRCFGREDWMSPVASGSGASSAMVVCPCSTGTLSAVACGASNNLIERAADVAIKERRQLIMVPRETPFSAIHLEHMLTLSRLGVVILPAAPGFYHRPQGVDDLIDFIVARILNQLGIQHALMPRWGETPGSVPGS